MADAPEVVHLDDDEDEEGETSQDRSGRTSFPKSKGVPLFTIDKIPPEEWEAKFQDFHAWMLAQNLTEESHFEILCLYNSFIRNSQELVDDSWRCRQDDILNQTRFYGKYQLVTSDVYWECQRKPGDKKKRILPDEMFIL